MADWTNQNTSAYIKIVLLLFIILDFGVFH